MHAPSFAPTQPMVLSFLPEPGIAASAAPPQREITAALYANRGWIIGCTLLFSAAAAGLYLVQSEVHTAVARVFVQTEQLGSPSFLSGITPYRESQIAEAANRRLETEIALITSRSNAADVVNALGITRRQLPRSPLAAAGSWLKDHAPESIKQITMQAFGRFLKPKSKSATPEDLLASVSIEPIRSKTAETTSNVLEIRLRTTDEALSVRALDSLLKGYLHSSGVQDQRLGEATTALLEQQLKTAASDLDQVERKVVQLASGKSRRGADELPGLITSADAAAPAVNAAAGREASRVANDTVMNQLASQVVDLQAKYDEQRTYMGDEAPVVKSLRERLASVRARLSSSVRNNAADNLEFTRLDRQRSLLQDRYLELRRKRDQIELFTRLNPSALDGRTLVDAPSAPVDLPTDGKSKLLLAAGPLLGLTLGLLIAGLRDLGDRRLRTAADVERALGLKTLGELPLLDRKRQRTLFASTLSFDELKTRKFT